jgi:predicted PurR-regulated permease PerM
MNNPSENNIKTYEAIISIAAIVLFGVLFASTELFRSPFITFGITLFVLIPFRKNRFVKIILILSLLIFVLWFVKSILGILIPFIIAFLLSYILNPLVEKLARRHIRRVYSSLIIIAGFIILIVVAMIFLVPVIIEQFSQFIKTLPAVFNNVQNWIVTVLIPWLASVGVPTQDLQSKLVNELPGRFEKIFDAFVGSISGLFTGLSVILSQLINIIIIPFLTFYILKDFEDIKSLVKELTPLKKRNSVISYYHKIDDLLGKYLRGALLVALINGTLVSILLSILGIKYSIFLGAISGLLDLIPYFGLLISLTLSTSVAFFSGNPSTQVPLTILTYIGLNILETSFLAPKIIGGKIGMHPAILILSLLIFAYFFGFVGLLIALPTVSIIIMFFKEWLLKREAIEQNGSE